MYLPLGDLTIHLSSDAHPIRERWSALFASWLREPARPAPAAPQLTLRLQLRQPPLPLPEGQPLYIDSRGILNVFRQEEQFLLQFLDGAVLQIPAAQRAATAEGVVAPVLLQRERLEDVTYASLAPLLRRQGYYLLHAFAVFYPRAREKGGAVLLVAPSGGGKTTSGLNLLLHGWQLLANDVVLLQERQGDVYALCTPGAITVRPGTLRLLPALAQHIVPGSLSESGAVVSPAGFVLQSAAPIRALCFPEVTGAGASRLIPEKGAVSLARLLEESADRWDEPSLAGHVALLQRLSRQAPSYRLLLGRDVEQLASLLEGLFSA